MEVPKQRSAEEILDLLQSGDEGVDLTADEALTLIEADEAWAVTDYIERFHGLDARVANALINTEEAWEARVVAAYLEKFQGVNHVEIAHKLIEVGAAKSVAKYLEKFQGVNHVEIAHKMIESDRSWAVALYLEKFQGLDHTEIALKIIEAGEPRAVANCLEKFQGVNHVEIAHKMIESDGGVVVTYFEKFQGLDHTEIALKLIKKLGADDVANNLEKFHNLDVRVAEAMIKGGKALAVGKHLEIFQDHSHAEIALKMLNSVEKWAVVNYIEKYHNLDVRVAEALINAGEACVVAQNLEKFQGLDHTEIASKAFDASNPRVAETPIGASWPDAIAPDATLHGSLDEVIQLLIDSGNKGALIDAAYDKRRDEADDAELYDNIHFSLTDFAEASYTYMKGGFSKNTIGSIIKTRMDNDIEYTIHDASQWLASFQMPVKWVDVKALKDSTEQVEATDLAERKVALKDLNVEARFILQLLDASSDLRARLTYGAMPRLSEHDKLQMLFSDDAYRARRGELNAQTGRARREITDGYYQELLADPAIKQAWQDFRAENPDAAEKKFFQAYFKDHADLATELDRRAIESQAAIESELLHSILEQDPDAAGIVESKTAKGGEDWFYYPEYRLLYQAACSDEAGKPLYKSQDFSLDTLYGRAHAMVDSYYDESFGRSKDETFHRMTKDELVEELNRSFKNLTSNRRSIIGMEQNMSDTVAELKNMSRDRRRYIQDTQSWLVKHVNTRSTQLKKAWGDRALAISEGIPDRVSAILAWQRLNAFKLTVDEMEENGKLQEIGLSREEIDTNPKTIAELTRVLSAKETLKAFSKIKKWTESADWDQKVLPAGTTSIDFNGVQSSLEIFGKGDPRGFTIGEDTVCCMTIDGESKSCIKAGYKRKNAGFLGVYEPSGDLFAQSFWYVTPDSPDVLVLDNIEANAGRNYSKLVKLYQELIGQYLKDHPDLGIREVRVGIGYSSADLNDLRDVENPEILDKRVYSDANEQKVLLSVGAQ
ncbi:hypothetical protein CR983_01680 [Candidatus Saccharibacteria bacterium]|nr:MAG: hypothetical protein CR983_01680 [Candidatus Saccharibacteria bacterium]